jgi:signal transduction histidine kinase
MPAAARVLIALVSLSGLAAVGYRLTRIGGLSARELLALVLVGLAVYVANRITFELPHGDDTEYFNLADGVWTAALVLTAPGVPTLAAALGTAAWQISSRWQLRKVAFNVGQVALALTLAEAALELGGGRPDPVSPVTWALAAAAMAAGSVVNHGLVALVIGLVQREPFHRVLFGPWRVNLIQWVGNVSVGLLAAVLWHLSPFGLLLLGLPCALLSLAYRDWIRSTIERNQMEQMMKGAEAIARERTFEARLPVGERSGRLPELAIALNHMLDQLELALHRQRQLMSDIAGQLRRPIGQLSRLVGDPVLPDGSGDHGRNGAAGNGSSPPADAPQEIGATLHLVGRILDDMAEIGRSRLPGFVDLRPVRVAELVTTISTRAEPFLGSRLRCSSPPPTALVAVDRDRIEEVLLRLLQNTADHGSGTRPVTFRAVEEDQAILFEVVDEGGGVPAGHEDAIFEPFYRAHARQDGVGLGLAMVRTVAEAHGGSAGVVNRPGAGVTFWVRVPR